MTAIRINKIIQRLEDNFGEYRRPSKTKPALMDVLIATKLSQNTTDKTSYIAFKNLKSDFKNWEDVMNSPLPKIKKSIKVCGLTNTKATQIKSMLKLMYKKYGNLSLNHLKKLSDSEVYEELLQYKGLGTKTVSCLLAFAMDRKVFPVDTHIHRILNRLGILETKSPEETFEVAKDIIPNNDKVNFHTNLIRFGRNVCKALNPLCNECLLFDLCEYGKKYIPNSTKKNLKPQNNFIILENL